MAEVAAAAGVKDSARHVIFEAAHGYTANVPLKEATADTAMVTYRLNGKPLARQHGGPALFVGVVGVARIGLLAHGVSPVGADDARRLIRRSSARTPVLALEFERGRASGFGRRGRPPACLPIARRHNGPLEPAEGLGTWRSNG